MKAKTDIPEPGVHDDENLMTQEHLERLFAQGLPDIGQTVGPNYKGYLDDEQVLEGIKAVARNAEELLADARLLFESGRYARSASLAILAVEESFKSLMLFVYPLIRGDEQGRKEFWKAWRDHRVKSSTPATAPFLWGQIDEKRRSELTEALGQWANTLKQKGFYADCREGGDSNGETASSPRWMLPSQVVSQREASQAIELAAAFVASIPEEDARWMLATTGSTENALGLLLALANRIEEFSGQQNSDVIAAVPDNLRRFVQSIAESQNTPGDDDTG